MPILSLTREYYFPHAYKPLRANSTPPTRALDRFPYLAHSLPIPVRLMPFHPLENNRPRGGKMTIQPSAHNNRIKYAWLRYWKYSTEDAKRLSQRQEMPLGFYEDLDKWFFYENGRLILDPTESEINKFVQEYQK